MKAISIKQPFASLIVTGVKDVENRNWKCPEKYIGQRVLIHASAKAYSWHWFLSYIQVIGIGNVIEKLGYKGSWLRNLPTGSIIGSVEISECVVNHPSVWAEKTRCYNSSMSKDLYEGITGNRVTYNWVLKNPIIFDEPIPCKGALMFWNYNLIDINK